MSEELRFDELPDSKEILSIKTAGVHLGFSLDTIEFVDAKVTPATAKAPEKSTNAYAKFLFKNATHSFQYFLFTPPVKEEDVKYCSDLYEKGVKVRKRTPTEQIRHEFEERFYFYEQLARSWNAPKEKLMVFKKGIAGDTETMFKRMFTKFFEVFTRDYYREKRINFKLVYNNNDKKKTSFLTLAKAEASNVVFATYVDEKTPVLNLSAYEEKNQVRKYKPQDQAPDSDGADAGSANGESDWKPATPDEKERELF